MAVRLLVLAHGRTSRTREAPFGDSSACLPLGDAPPLPRIVSAVCGPEPAARGTADWLGGAPEVSEDLRGCDFGDWHGRTLAEVGRDDPAAVAAWLGDAGVAPHGGESLAALVARVGSAVDGWTWPDGRPWPDGRSLVVVTPLVARALLVHALGAPPEVIFRVDVAPLDVVSLSRSGGSGWRLQGLAALDRAVSRSG